MTSANIAVYLEEVDKNILSNGKGVWLELPLCNPDDRDFNDALEEWLEEEELNNVAVMHTDSDWNELELKCESIEELEELNALVWRLENDLGIDQVKVVRAMLEEYYDLEEAINAAEAGDVYLLTAVNDDEDYGYYAVDEGLFGIDVPDSLKHYLDYEKIGRDIRLEGDIVFTSYGCLCGLNSI